MSYFLCDEFKDMEPYIPGEQPRDRAYIKLNANESSLPPSPKVLEAVSKSSMLKMGFYSDPHCLKLREAIAEVCGVVPEQVFVGNGADEVLGFCFMSFFSPRMKLCFPDITYDFYRTYAKTNRIDFERIPLDENFDIKVEDYIRTDRDIVLANPNNPTGKVLKVEEIERIVAAKPKRMVIVDEAYIDYGNASCIPLVAQYPNLVVVQTFSKSRNLAGARIGFAVSSREIIEDMSKIKFAFNPFNMSEFAIRAGAAAVLDTKYLEKCVSSVVHTRERTRESLEKMGFRVPKSHTNFLLASHPAIYAGDLAKRLKEKGVLIRHYDEDRIREFIRVTIGTETEMASVVDTLKEIMGELGYEDYHQ